MMMILLHTANPANHFSPRWSFYLLNSMDYDGYIWRDIDNDSSFTHGGCCTASMTLLRAHDAMSSSSFS